MEIKRDSYLEQLKIRKDNGMIKIITGIRRCGKSEILFFGYRTQKCQTKLQTAGADSYYGEHCL